MMFPHWSRFYIEADSIKMVKAIGVFTENHRPSELVNKLSRTSVCPGETLGRERYLDSYTRALSYFTSENRTSIF